MKPFLGGLLLVALFGCGGREKAGVGTDGNDPTADGSPLVVDGGGGHKDAGMTKADASTCPLASQFGSAIGKPCSPNGMVCNAGCPDPCQFCNVLSCEGGKWTPVENFPDPNCKKDAGVKPLDSSPTCPPQPPCNWCGGSEKKDAQGCTVGYTCANGINPCQTQPCFGSPCPAGQACDSTGLCWPAPFACGTAQCKGNEFCLKELPGNCGSVDKTDAGVCPPGCCYVGTGCYCPTFACLPLPVGCANCGCIGKAGTCPAVGPNCTQQTSGAIEVICAYP
jgi:hypothetical protein